MPGLRAGGIVELPGVQLAALVPDLPGVDMLRPDPTAVQVRVVDLPLTLEGDVIPGGNASLARRFEGLSLVHSCAYPLLTTAFC